MSCLRAVGPDRGSVVNDDGVGGGLGCTSSDGHEARVEASDVAVHGNGLAWLIEGRLGDRVVSTSELELHHITYGGLDIIGRVLDSTRLGANGDDVHIGRGLSYFMS